MKIVRRKNLQFQEIQFFLRIRIRTSKPNRNKSFSDPQPCSSDRIDRYRVLKIHMVVVQIFFAATNEDPNQRPSAKEILQILGM